MDNSFFCIKSYNIHPITNHECLQCIGGKNPHDLCEPFPSRIKKSAAFNENVVTVQTEYGYEGEITGIKNHLRLSKDIQVASMMIRRFLQDKKIEIN